MTGSQLPDVVIRGGLVVDGSGRPGYTADVAITSGHIASVGKLDRVKGKSVQEIDADGLVVTPGFIDIHTHYDAQLWFEPTASPSCWHGVTTVVTGNCGFTLAPSKPSDVHWLLRMLSRVEGMSPDALEIGVTFPGGSLGSFLDMLDRRIGVNAAMYVGHCAVRRHVMGDDSSLREATPAEISAMASLVRTAMEEGAIGFSSSQLDLHRDHEGRPVPSNLATPDEIVALCEVLGEFPYGMIGFLPRSSVQGYSAVDRDLLLRMAKVSGKPVHTEAIGWVRGHPDSWRESVSLAREASHAGLEIHPMLVVNPKGVHLSLANTFIFDEITTFREVLTLPHQKRLEMLRDPTVRDRLRSEIGRTEGRALVFGWDELRVVLTMDPAHHNLDGRTVAELSSEAGVDPLDAFLDLAIDEDLETIFLIDRNARQQERAVIDEAIGNGSLVIGSSDGGAHLQTFCGADYTTRFLAELVPESLPLEDAVARLTSVPARLIGLSDRGAIRTGMAADLVVLDPNQLGVGPPRLVSDFPRNAQRLIFEPAGYHAVLVNGQPVMQDGQHTGSLPGTVLRGGSLSRA
jgi:N-acyl-D-aspartate/D-glutamate deacylase